MLTLFYDFIPVLLFFIAFKTQGIYTATIVGIAATAVQVLITAVVFKKIDNKQLLTLVVFSIFGGMTLYFHNPIFVKWKPSIVFWIFGIILLLSQFIGKYPIMQRLLTKAVSDPNSIPPSLWRKLNISWALFFISLGLLNIWIAYHYSTDTWVNFKVYGILLALILFSVVQAFFLAPYLKDETKR